MTVASSNEVRSWLTSKGIVTGARGRFKSEHIESFNKAHKSKKFEAGVAPERVITVKVPTKNSKGANITKTVKVPAKALREGTATVGQRGRVNTDAAVQYVIGAGLV